MRDMLAYRYFDTTYAIVMATVRNDVPRLAEVVRRVLGARESDPLLPRI